MFSRLVALLVAVVLLVPLSAQAQTYVRCDVRVTEPGFHVMEMSLDRYSTFQRTQVGGQWEVPHRSGDEWVWVVGLFVVDRATLDLVTYDLVFRSGNAPEVIVNSNGIEERRALDYGPGSNAGFHFGPLPADFAPGEYLVIFMWWGEPGWGIYGETYWFTSFRSRGLDPECRNIAEGEMYGFDQRDFDGTQIHVPGAGVGQNLRLDHVFEREFIVGSVLGGHGSPVGHGGLKVIAPDMTVDGPEGLIMPIFSRGGLVQHEAHYQGLDPVIFHGGFAFDLVE